MKYTEEAGLMYLRACDWVALGQTSLSSSSEALRGKVWIKPSLTTEPMTLHEAISLQLKMDKMRLHFVENCG